MADKLLLVGNPGPEHIGAHLLHAAHRTGLEVHLCDSTLASQGPRWRMRMSWRLGGHRPLGLNGFSRQVVHACEGFRPRVALCVGLVPVDRPALQEIGRLGMRRLNYLTDDPWNPAHRAGWFLEALREYDVVFSTRRANLDDLRRAGCHRAVFLPFAYAPEIHFPDPPSTDEEKARFGVDVVFAGGADRDRLPWIEALIRGGFKVGLYGGYWERFPQTRATARGNADPPTLRKAIGGAKVALCLVRRANRDGNSMRSFEIPAMKACMLTEDTEEHREIFGEEGKAVVYFRNPEDMLKKTHWMLEHEEERQRLSLAAYRLITQGGHTYRDRLLAMLSFANGRLIKNAA